MLNTSRFRLRIFIALIVVASFTCTGTAADQDQVACQRWGNCSAAGYYGPGMMGGYSGTGAYGMMNASGVRMMESVEIRAMGGPLHDEMQGLVTKLRSGNLNSAEQVRMIEIMDEYPGASNLMIARMTGGYGPDGGGYPGMTGWYDGNSGMMRAGTAGTGLMILGILLVTLFFLVWLVAGILLILWLVRQLRKNERPS